MMKPPERVLRFLRLVIADKPLLECLYVRCMIMQIIRRKNACSELHSDDDLSDDDHRDDDHSDDDHSDDDHSDDDAADDVDDDTHKKNNSQKKRE